MTALRAQVEGLASALQAMQFKRPPVHYLKLRALREELEAGRRELAGLREPTVRFTGLLSLRIPGGDKMKVRRLFVVLLWSTSAGAGDLELTVALEAGAVGGRVRQDDRAG